MTRQTAPLGIFDSGVGGLSVLRQVQRLLPAESVVYYADTANVPYGDKPVAVVRDLALRLTEHLVRAGCKAVLMASGTSTVAGLDAARAAFSSAPIFGTVDGGARAAVQCTHGPVGVLATNATVQAKAFTQAVTRLAPGRTVVEVGCPRFVPLVEAGQADSADARDAARVYLGPLLAAGTDAIILGCTHFPFLLDALRCAARETGAHPTFVDPAQEAVQETRAALEAQGLLAPPGSVPTVQFAATGDPEDFRFHASALLGQDIARISRLAL